MDIRGAAVVVGGGVGGLAAACALGRAGWSVRVLERRPDPAGEGSGLSVWPNALRALDALGVGDEVRAAGVVQAAGGLRDRRGRWLARTEPEVLARRYGDGIVVLARADLLAILRDALPARALTTGVEVTGVPTVGDSPVARASLAVRSDPGPGDVPRPDAAPGGRDVVGGRVGDGLLEADLVVGADGIGSAVRSAAWPSAAGPRSTGTTAWRLTASADGPTPTEGGESWGDGEYVGVAPLPDGRVYLWAVVRDVDAPAGGDPAGDLAWLRRRLADWHDPVPALLERVAPADVARTGLSFLPALDSFVRGRVVLLGDAAHAMTPNLGQGACQALEDAATLGVCLRSGPVDEGLVRYDRLRRPRTTRLVRMSRVAGRVAGLRGRVPTTVRDTLVRRTAGALPDAVRLRGLDDLLGWRPPS